MSVLAFALLGLASLGISVFNGPCGQTQVADGIRIFVAESIGVLEYNESADPQICGHELFEVVWRDSRRGNNRDQTDPPGRKSGFPKNGCACSAVAWLKQSVAELDVGSRSEIDCRCFSNVVESNIPSDLPRRERLFDIQSRLFWRIGQDDWSLFIFKSNELSLHKTALGFHLSKLIGYETVLNLQDSQLSVHGGYLPSHSSPLLRGDPYVSNIDAQYEKGENSHEYIGARYRGLGIATAGIIAISAAWWNLWRWATRLSSGLSPKRGRLIFIAGVLVAGACLIWHGLDLIFSEELDYRSENASASIGYFCVSASPYSRAEDIGIAAIVIAPFEFGDIQRQIFAADLVIAAHNPALQERPEAVDGRGVDCPADILTRRMVDAPVVEQAVQWVVSSILIGRNQADLFRDRLANEGIKRCGISVSDDASNNISLSLNSADDGLLASSPSAGRSGGFVRRC